MQLRNPSMPAAGRPALPALQPGFSLVEVLIALIIISVGMLGIAGLYVQSMQAGRTSMFRHNAVILVGDVADRIRANPRAGATYATVGGTDEGCVAGGVSCTAAEMASHDIFLWTQQAAQTLPGGTVTVAFDGAVTPPTYQITANWTEAGDNLSYGVEIPVRN